MPTTKTAIKEMRASARREDRNRSNRSQTKTVIQKAEKAIAAGDVVAAAADVKIAVSSLDKQAEKGKIHRNNAARRKSRLVKKLNQAAKAGQKSQ